MSKIEVKNDSSYFATVCRLTNVRNHPNADRMKIANALGFNVIVGLGAEENDLVVLFPSDGKLSREMCLNNNLYRKHPDTGKEMGGYFEENGRVKAIRLRKASSEAFVIGLESLSWAGATDLKEGDTFTHLNGNLVCEKYYTPATLRAMGRTKGSKKTLKAKDFAPDFFEHFKTQKVRHSLVDILCSDGGVPYIVTEKLHGCVSEDTIVETKEYGDITIGEIVKNRLPVNIKAFDTEEKEIVFVPIDDYYFLPDDGEWYEITLEDGTILEITGNNPVWLPDIECYRRVDELEVGDRLLTD